MYPKHQHLPPEAIAPAIALLRGWLQHRLTADAFAWFDTELSGLQNHPEQGRWFKALGLAPRKLGKADLKPSRDELQAADQLRHGLDPTDWSIDQTARIVFTLAVYQADDASFAQFARCQPERFEPAPLFGLFLQAMELGIKPCQCIGSQTKLKPAPQQ